jgi:hypothetical protein
MGRAGFGKDIWTGQPLKINRLKFQAHEVPMVPNILSGKGAAGLRQFLGNNPHPLPQKIAAQKSSGHTFADIGVNTGDGDNRELRFHGASAIPITNRLHYKILGITDIKEDKIRATAQPVKKFIGSVQKRAGIFHIVLQVRG